jgi:hypothetical protein
MTDNLVYKPFDTELKPCEPRIGFKFSNDIFIHPSQLDKWGLEYTQEDLEDNPILGKALRIKREKNET